MLFRSPQLGLDGAAVAVADVLGHKLDHTLVVQGCGTVLGSQQVLVVITAGGIVRGLVKVSGLKGDGCAGVCIDDKCIVMKHLDLVLAAMLCMGQGRLTGT